MRESGLDPKLENEADKFLKESAKATRKPNGQPYIRANGRGFTEYAVDFGILTKKHQEKIRQTEITGLDMEHSMRPIGEKHSKKEESDG